MDGYDIRRLMKENNVKGKDIAKELGVSSANVSKVIHGVPVSSRIREAIASKLQKPVSDLWPED